MPSHPTQPPDFPASQLFLRRLAFHLVRDEAKAEDLVQDTWTAWIEHRPEGVVEPRAWLARVLRNRAFNAKRAEERRTRREHLAGRPDPSAPETDGTLEAQAQMLEALRKLEEPFRSTLLQRYYHDLSPKAIAERSGTPLNTVKARLARGLEKLRGAMDRRYGGDRRAWCHWLTVVGAPAVPLGPGAAPAKETGAIPGAGSVGGLPLLAWIGVVGLLAVATWRSGRNERSRGPKAPSPASTSRSPEVSRPSGRVVVPGREALSPPRAKLAEKEADASSLPPEQPLEAVGYVSVAERESFEWPQYGGGAEHDSLRSRKDEIGAPKVVWFVPGCVGQPTLLAGDLYAGGTVPRRIDPISGAVLSSEETCAAIMASALVGKENPALQVALAHSTGEERPKWGASWASPALTGQSVLFRRLDGGVTAFDRALEKELWSWTPHFEEPPFDMEQLFSAFLSGCLVDEELLFLVPYDEELVALRVRDGSVAWRFDASHEDHVRALIQMVPACSEGRVFFGAGWSRFFALDVRTGEKLWEAELGGFSGGLAPAVIGKRVLCVDRGDSRPAHASPFSEEGLRSIPGAGGHLHALNIKSGREDWKTPFEGVDLSLLGNGPKRYAVAGFAQEVVRFDLARGRIDERRTIETGGHPLGSPTVVGASLVFGSLDGHLYVYDLDGGELRWAFRAPDGAQVHEFVHSGKRIYVTTSIGLFCIADDTTRAPPSAGFVLEWRGDTTKPSYQPEKR